MFETFLKETKNKMDKVLKAIREDFNTVRTGKAQPLLVENILVDYYGASTPLQQMAKIATPEPRLLLIDPWDKNVIANIEKAIMKANLGLNPGNDGNVIRINIPQLTEERRKELVKISHDKAENGKIAVRNLRRDSNDYLKKMENESEISEDIYYRLLDKIQEITDEYIEKIDQMLKEKEEDIMEV
jgi:ribosome recycling factor